MLNGRYKGSAFYFEVPNYHIPEVLLIPISFARVLRWCCGSAALVLRAVKCRCVFVSSLGEKRLSCCGAVRQWMNLQGECATHARCRWS